MAIPLKYNLRSLLVRRISTLMTMFSIALVVAIFVGVMALATGIETALVTSGDPLNVLVRREGSDSEVSSTVPRDAFQTIKYLSGVRPDDRGEPLAAAEIVVVINLFRQGGEEQTNVSVRGLSPSSFDLRPKIQMTEGRMFQQGLREVIIGKGISTRFQNTKLGDVLRFGKADWTVVGLFDAGGTAFDSEIWCDVNQLASDYNRDSYSSVLLRASSASAVGEIISRIQDDRRYDIAAQPEIAYYEEQTATAAPIRAIGFFVAIVMGIGACFAAANTMYAAVAYRTREIATLRILGFKRGSILLSFMIESLTLALIGGVLGCVLALPINGITGGTANWQTFSEIAFAFRVTPGLVGIGMGFALLMGLFGGFFPARRASKQEPAGAMREV